MIFTSKVTQKGQATIPVKIRESLGVGKNTKIVFRLHNGSVTLEKELKLDDVIGTLKPKKKLLPLTNSQTHKLYEKHLVERYNTSKTSSG